MDTENNRLFFLKDRIVAFFNLIYNFSFGGKFSRKEWWTYFLLSIVLNLHVIIWTFLFAGALIFVVSTFGMGYSILSDVPSTPNDILRPFLGYFTNIISQLLFFIGCYLYFTSTIKRFHDRGKGWWWSFMVFVPVIGIWWVLIECGFLKGISDSSSLDSDNKINENKLTNYGGNLFLLLCIFLMTIFYYNGFLTHKNSTENNINYVYVDGKKVSASEFAKTNDARYFIRNNQVYLRSCYDCATPEYVLMPGMSTTSFSILDSNQIDENGVFENQNRSSSLNIVNYKTPSQDCDLKSTKPLLKIMADVDGSTSTEVVVPDIISAIKKSGIETTSDIYSVFAQPENSDIIVLSGSKCHTEGGQYPLISYNTKTSIFTKLKVSENHSFWNAWRLSPDKMKIIEATWSENSPVQLMLLDLINDTKIVLKELPVGKNFSSICELGCQSNLKWIDNSTIEYGIYNNPTRVINGESVLKVHEKPEQVIQININSPKIEKTGLFISTSTSKLIFTESDKILKYKYTDFSCGYYEKLPNCKDNILAYDSYKGSKIYIKDIEYIHVGPEKQKVTQTFDIDVATFTFVDNYEKEVDKIIKYGGMSKTTLVSSSNYEEMRNIVNGQATPDNPINFKYLIGQDNSNKYYLVITRYGCGGDMIGCVGNIYLEQINTKIFVGETKIDVSEVDGMHVLFNIVVNNSKSCKKSEYKVDYGDGKNDWFEVKENTCLPKKIMYSHTYSFDGKEKFYTARLHDLTDISYYEPAFSEVENPVSSTTFKVTR